MSEARWCYAVSEGIPVSEARWCYAVSEGIPVSEARWCYAVSEGIPVSECYHLHPLLVLICKKQRYINSCHLMAQEPLPYCH